MRRQDQQAIPFGDYLDAKFALDDRSLNEAVRRTLLDELEGRERLTCLDLGAGTGAMIRRLLKWFSGPELSITALDRNPDVLATARRRITDELQFAHFVVNDKGSWLRGESIGRTVNVEFVCCGWAEFNPSSARYDLATAHAFVDLVAPVSLLTRLDQWLTPGGYLYASLNYDGGTFLFPGFEDADFERALLDQYNGSMEARRPDGEATGGAHSGSRLLAALAGPAWNTIAYGSSDWNLTPVKGVYRDRDSVCLQTLLEFMRCEAGLAGFDQDELARWTGVRARQLANRQLGMIVHQLDLLAQYQRIPVAGRGSVQ